VLFEEPLGGPLSIILFVVRDSGRHAEEIHQGLETSIPLVFTIVHVLFPVFGPQRLLFFSLTYRGGFCGSKLRRLEMTDTALSVDSEPCSTHDNSEVISSFDCKFSLPLLLRWDLSYPTFWSPEGRHHAVGYNKDERCYP